MAVVLSNKIRMCKLESPAANENKHSFAACNSKVLICRGNSETDHLPPTVECKSVPPQPSRLASE